MSGLRSFDPEYVSVWAEEAAKEESAQRLKLMRREIEADLQHLKELILEAKSTPAGNLALELDESRRRISDSRKEIESLKAERDSVMKLKEQAQEELRESVQSGRVKEFENQICVLRGRLSVLEADSAKKAQECTYWKNECRSWQSKCSNAAPHLRKQLKDCEVRFQKKCEQYDQLLKSKYELINKSTGK